MSNQKATPRGSAASNVFNMLNMMFFLTFCTEALNLNVVVVGVVMTAMRLFDVITNPIIGPVSGIAGGVYSTLIGAAVTVGIVPLLQKYGGLGSQQCLLRAELNI